MMGGDIDGHQRAGQGLDFTVRLPARVAKAATAGSEPTQPRDVRSRPGRREPVLVIDDDPASAT